MRLVEDVSGDDASAACRRLDGQRFELDFAPRIREACCCTYLAIPPGA